MGIESACGPKRRYGKNIMISWFPILPNIPFPISNRMRWFVYDTCSCIQMNPTLKTNEQKTNKRTTKASYQSGSPWDVAILSKECGTSVSLLGYQTGHWLKYTNTSWQKLIQTKKYNVRLPVKTKIMLWQVDKWYFMFNVSCAIKLSERQNDNFSSFASPH